MTRDPFSTVYPGMKFRDVVTSNWVNTISQGVKDSSGDRPDGSIPNNAGSNLLQLLAEYTESTDLVPFSCVKVEEPIYDPNVETDWELRKPVLTATAAETGEPFGICLEYFNEDDVRPVALTGYTLALVNITDTDHTTAGPETGETVLQSGKDGARIYWKPSGTGEKLCLVILGQGAGTKFYLATSQTTIIAGSTNNTVNVVNWSDASGGGSTLDNVRFDWITDGEDISAGKQLLIAEQDGIRRIIGAECETEQAAALVAPALSMLLA